MMAGDDDQCLYRFKGATPDAFLNPPIPDDHKRFLPKSYRLPRLVHGLAEEWISKVKVREPKKYEPRAVEGFIGFDTRMSWQNTAPIVSFIDKMLQKSSGDVMILGACSYMLQPIVKHLRAEGIPFHNPYRTKRGDWNPLRRSGRDGVVTSSDRLLAYLRPDDLTWGDKSSMWLGSDLKKWIPLLESKRALKKGAKSKLEDLPDDQEIEVSKLVKIFNEEVFPDFLFEDEKRLMVLWENMLKVKRKTMEFPICVARKYTGKMLSEDPRVVVGTIHSVKGAEAETVILFPDLSNSGATEWLDIQGGGRDSIIRQFYVAITRTKHTLIICNPISMNHVDLKSSNFFRYLRHG